MSVGAVYKSHLSNRTLSSDVNMQLASPTLRGGGPPRKKEFEAMLHLPDPEIGTFTVRPTVAPAMLSLAKTRAMNVTSALTSNIRSSATDGREDTYAAIEHHTTTDQASAGSFHPHGPALTDPDGISAAVSTLRRFRGLIESDGGRPVAESPKSPDKVANVGQAMTALDFSTRLTQEEQAKLTKLMAAAKENSAGATAGTGRGPLLHKAPPSLIAAIAASAAGSAVVGTITFPRENMMKVTMVASKWTRVVSTHYGASAHEPCKIVVEMQQQYYTAFLNDLHEATRGEFEFSTEPAPTAIKANVGALNMLIKQGETDFAPHLLPVHTTNKKKKFKVVKQAESKTDSDMRAFRAMGLTSLSEALVSTSIASRTHRPTSAGARPGSSASSRGAATSTALVPRTGSRPSSASGRPLSGTSTALTLRAGATHTQLALRDNTADDTVDARYEAPLEWKGKKVMSDSTVHWQEFNESKKQAELRAGRKMRGAAKTGDTTLMARLVIRGEPVYLDPRPWYEQEVHVRTPDIGHTPETNPHLVTTDIVVKPPVDFCEKDGDTALMAAVRAYKLDSVNCLMEMGADPKKLNREGRNAIHICMDCVEKSAEEVSRNVSGAVARRQIAANVMKVLDTRTLIEVAKEHDFMKAKFMLEVMQEDAAQQNAYGMTALHFAVMNQDDKLAQLLMQHGANPRARNSLGQTPLSLIDDIDRARERRIMHAAFSHGSSGDAERRQKLRVDMEKRDAERTELLKFEQKLKTLTRGTTAAKTLAGLTKIIKDGVARTNQANAPPRSSSPRTAAASSAPRGTPVAKRRAEELIRPAKPLVHVEAPPRPFSNAATGSRPQLMSGNRTQFDKLRSEVSSTHHPVHSPIHTEPPDFLYADSAKRHMKDFVAVSMKEKSMLDAKKKDAAVTDLVPQASIASVQDSLDFTEFYTAAAPSADDRKFDVWFKAHVSNKAATTKLKG